MKNMNKPANPLTRTSRSESKHETHSRLILPALFMCALTLLTSHASAQNTWTGTVNTLWSDVGNWSGGVPAFGNVVINDVTNDTLLNGIGDTTTLDITGNILTVGGATTLFSDTVTISGTGNLILSTTGEIVSFFNSDTSVLMNSSGFFFSTGGVFGDLSISSGTTTFIDDGFVTGTTTITGGVLNLNAVDFRSDITVSGGLLNYTPNTGRTHSSDLILDGGTVTYNSAGNNAQQINGNVTVNDTSLINIAAGGVGLSGFILNGNLNGIEDLTVNTISPGVGLVLRGNASSYTGTLTVNGNDDSGQGIGSGLALGNVGIGLAGANLVINGTLELGDSATSMGWSTDGTVNTTTASIGALNGSGVVVGNMRNAASTRTLSIGNNIAGGTFSGSIVDGFQNTLSLVKTGTVTQTLSGDNTYSGTTTVSGGTLQFATTQSLYNGSTAEWTAANINVKVGATIALNVDTNGTAGFTALSLDTLLGNISSPLAANQGLEDGATVAFDTSTDGNLRFTYNGNITDSSGGGGGLINFTKLGEGNLFLGGNNTFTGETTVTEGTLVLESDSALGTIDGGTTVADGARLRLDSVNIGEEDLEINGTGIAGNGALASTGTSSFAGEITVATDSSIFTNGDLTLTGDIINNGTSLTFTGGGEFFVSGLIDGNGPNSDIIVDGAELNLDGTSENTYGGNTIIRSTLSDTGILNANSSGALAHATSPFLRSRVIMDDLGAGGSELNLGADQFIASLSGASSSLVDLNSNTLTIGEDPLTTTTFAGEISGSGGLIKRYNSKQVLSGQNTYTGDTLIFNGTLRAGAGANGQAFGDNSAVIIDDEGSAELDLNDTNQTIGSLEGNGRVRLGSGILTTGGNDSSTTYTGLISGGGDLIKTGTGIFTLDNQNVYNGRTTINEGTLEVSQNDALGTNNRGTTVANGATLSLFGVNYTTAEALTITGTGDSGNGSDGALLNNGSSTYAGQITVLNGASISAGNGDLTLTGGIVKNGTTLTLTGGGNIIVDSVISGNLANSDLIVDGVTVDLNAANTYNGPTYIRSTALNDGVINANVLGALPNTNDQATRTRVIMDDNGSGGSQLNLFTDQSIASLTGANSSLVDLNSNILTIGQNGAPDATFAGEISGLGGLDKRNGNTQILSGKNTYEGDTLIFNGTLRAAGTNTDGQAFGNLSAVIIDDQGNATLDLNSTDQVIGSLAGDGSVTLGSGTLFTGGDDTNTTYDGVISGTGGGLTKRGAGTFTLTNDNTYTGETKINSGTLELNGSTAAGSTVIIQTNGTLTGTGTVFGNATLSGNGSINFGAGGNIVGTLGVTGGNWNGLGTVTGAITSSSGVFTIGSGANLTATSGLNITGGTIAAGNTLSTLTGSLNYTSNDFSIFQGIIAGLNSTVTVNKDTISSGSGLRLTGANTYGGLTTVTSGLLEVVGATATIGTNLNAIVSDKGTLALSGATIGQAIQITGFGTRNLGLPSIGAINAFGPATSIIGGGITLVGDASIRSETGSTLNLNGGVVKNGTTLTLTGGGTINVNNVGISGSLANSDLIVDGAIVSLNATNTYNGPTFIRSSGFPATGILTTNAVSALPTQNGRTALTMDDSGLGGSQLILGGAFSQSVASLTGAASSLINLNANTLTIGTTAGVTNFRGVISGGGGLIKDGDSTQTLSGNNIYNGLTVVNDGVLRINSNTGLGSTAGGTTVNSGGSLLIVGVDIGAEALQINGNGGGNGALENSGTSSYAGLITVATNSSINAGGGNLTLTGGLVNNDNRLTLTGGGSITINTVGISGTATSTLIVDGVTVTENVANTYNGPTFIRSTAVAGSGILNANAANALPTLNGRSALTMDDSGLGSSQFNLGAAQSVASLTGAGSSLINLNANTLTIGVLSGAYTTFDGVISGGGGLIKDGDSTQVLSGNNTYTGSTLVQTGGVLRIESNNGLGSTVAGTTVQSGGRLRIVNVDIGNETLEINGSGVADNGALANVGISSYAGFITAASDATIKAGDGILTLTGGLSNNGTELTLAGGGIININSNGISGAAANSNLVINGVTTNLNVNNTYNGSTFIRSTASDTGILNANVGQAMPNLSPSTRSRLVMDDQGTGSSLFNLGANQAIASLTGASSSLIDLNNNTLTIGQNGAPNANFAGVIDGTGGLTKRQDNLQILSGINTYTGVTDIINGTLQVDGSIAAGSNVAVGTDGTLSGSGTVFGNATLTGDGIINFGPTGNIAGTLGVTGGNWNGSGSVTGLITSSSGVFNIGPGASLTATTGLNVTGGTIAAGNALSTINGSILYTSNEFSTFQGRITGAGSTVTVDNESSGSLGGLLLTGANSYGGLTTVTSGYLAVSGGSNIGTNTNAIVSNTGTLALSGVSIAQNIQITGAGTLNFGTTPLGAINAYGGATSSIGGLITLSGNASIRSENGSTLNLNGGVVKNGTTLTLTGGGTINVNNVGISGSLANSDLIVDGVTVNENVTNTYNGPTFIRSTAVAGTGILNTNAVSALPTLNGRSALTMDDSGLGASRLNLIGGFSQSVASLQSLTTGAASSLINLNGNTLTIGSASLTPTTFAGIISGAGGLITKDGDSTQVFTGANTYTGATAVTDGVLNIQNATALGTIAAGTSVTSGAALQIQGGITVGAEALTLNGSGVSNDGALRNIINDNTFGGLITLGSAARINSDANLLTLSNAGTITGAFGLTVGGAGNTRIDSIIGTGVTGTLTKDGAGTLTLFGTNTYSGATTVTDGTLRAGATAGGQAFGSLSAVTIANSATAILDLAGFNQTIGSLAGVGPNGSVTLGNGTLTTGGNNTSTTFEGVILANGGNGGLTKNGNGIFTLTGANTYTGATAITAGTLQINSNTGLGTIAGGTSVTSGATLTLNGVSVGAEALTINGTGVSAGGALRNFGSTSNSSFAGAITVASNSSINANTGSLTLSGGLVNNGNSLTLTGGGIININTVGISGTATSTLIVDGVTVNENAANTYSGPTFIRSTALAGSGILNANVVGALPTATRSALTMDDSGLGSSQLNLGAAQSIASLTGAASSRVDLNNNTLTIGNATNTSTTFAGIISGTGGGLSNLTKDGASTQILSGANTYTGLTTVSAGTLVLSTAGGRLNAASSLRITGGELTFVNFETVSSFTQTGGILDFDVDHPGGVLLNCQLNPGVDNDRLIVNGTATLGGTIQINKQGVEFQRGERAILIDARNGDVNIGSPVIFDPTTYLTRNFLVIDDNTDLVSVLGTGITGQNGNLRDIAGLTANQKAIANAINTNIIPNNNILDATVEMDQIALLALGDCTTAPGAGLNRLSPEAYAGFADYGVQTIKSYTTNALSLPGYSKDGTARSVRIPVGVSSEPMASTASGQGLTSMFAGYSHYNTATESSLNGADYDISSNGGILGVRHEVNRWTLGGFFAVDEGHVDSTTLSSEVEAFLLGAIASYVVKPEMNLMVTGGLTYGSYEFSGTRQTLGTVSFDDVGSDVLDIHVAIEGDVYNADKLRVTPFFGLHYIYSETEAFTEKGPGALSMTAHEYDAFFSEIGIKAEYELNEKLSLNGNLSYTHNLMGSDKNIGASLGGTPFSVSSPGLGNDILTIGLGAQFQLTEAIRLGINYRAEFTADAEAANGLNIGGSYSF